MRIYGVADIHARPARIDQLYCNISRYAPDVLVIAGDITSFRHPGDILARLNALPVPVLVVRGNTDLRRMDNLFNGFNNIYSLHLKRFQMLEMTFVGISGTVPVPFRSRLAFFEKSLVKKARALIDRGTILVVHPPPYGTLDQVMGRFHAGARSVADLIKAQQPRLVLCGHVHEAFGQSRIGDTPVVNCNMAGHQQGALVDILQSGKAVIQMLSHG